MDWVPTLNLGHDKKGSDTDSVQAPRSARNERARLRETKEAAPKSVDGVSSKGCQAQ